MARREIRSKQFEVTQKLDALKNEKMIHNKILKITNLDSEFFLDNSFKLVEKRINVFCGGNGAGKTRVLNELYRGIKDGDESLTLRIENGKKNGHKIENIVYFDMHSSGEIKDFLSTHEIQTLLDEELEKRSLSQENIAKLSHMVGRNYCEIEVYEIPEENINDNLKDLIKIKCFPYFRVKFNDIIYETPKMGMGEYALFYLFYLLENLEEDTSIFLEEPENFLSPISQNGLTDYIIDIVEIKKLILYISTHSPYIVKRFPKECTTVLFNLSGKIEFQAPHELDSVLDELGLDINIKGVIIVEDFIAKEIVSELIIEKFSNCFFKKYEILTVNEKTLIENLIESDVNGDNLEVIYFLNKDIGNTHKKLDEKKICFIPGELSFELEAIKIIKENIKDVAKKLRRKEHDVRRALSKAQGKDKYRWLEEISTELKHGEKEFIGILSKFIFEKYKPDVETICKRLGKKDIDNLIISDPESEKDHLIITEGKTDWKHIKNAYNKLKNDGLYNKVLYFKEYEEEIQMGDKNLITLCEQYSKISNKMKFICIFDRDVASTLKNIGQDNFKNWGNNVFSFAIPVPDHRSETPEISIEHYYSDDEIKTFDDNCRRLYLGSEFTQKTGTHVTEEKICVEKNKAGKKSIKIIDNNVYEFKNETNNIALTKENFAKNILSGNENFKDLNYLQFLPILERISEILEK